jgi:hypothetical protein
MEYILERRKNMLQLPSFYHKNPPGLNKNKKIFIIENQSKPAVEVATLSVKERQTQEIIQGCRTFSN